MKLTVELKGYKNHVVITALPVDFVQKVIRHCMGKNNTTYFMNNCFKGVLYFDEELAARFASDCGFEWEGWAMRPAFHQSYGYLVATSLDIAVFEDDTRIIGLPANKLDIEENHIPCQSVLDKLEEGQMAALLGAVDKGGEKWVLDDFEGGFNPARLVATVDEMEEFYFTDQYVTGLAYDGRPLTRVDGESTGRNMIVPVLMNKEGEERELFDIIPESPLPDGILL